MKLKNIYNLTVITASLSLFVMIGCKKNDPETVNKATLTLYQAIGSDQQLSIYRAALKQAGIDNAETFSQGGPLTVFAPVDSAFIKAGYTLDNIGKADPQTLGNILKYGMLYGRVSSQSLAGFYSESIHSKDTPAQPRVTKNYYGIFFDGIPLITAQSRDLNDGVLHEVQRLPQPPVDNIYGIISKSPNFTLYTAMLKKIGVDIKLSLPPVLNPYSNPFADGSLYYTLFAPTDEAFKNAGYPDVNAINNAPINILYHLYGEYFYPGKLLTSDFKGGYTLNPSYVAVDGLTIIDNGTLTPTHIIRPDMIATNGVIQVVDQVFTSR